MPMSRARVISLRAQPPDSVAQTRNSGTPAHKRGAVPEAQSCSCGTPIAERAAEASRLDQLFSDQTAPSFTLGLAIVLQDTPQSTTLRETGGRKVPISRTTTPRTMLRLQSKP